MNLDADVQRCCIYCMREWLDFTRAPCEACSPELPLGDLFNFDQAGTAVPTQPPMQWQNLPAVDGNFSLVASDLNALTTPSLPGNQQVNAPFVYGANFQGHSTLANPNEPLQVNAQQEAAFAIVGNNAAAFVGERDWAQVNAQRFPAGQLGEHGHQGVGPLATPPAATAAEAAGGGTTRAPRTPLARKTPEGQRRQLQKRSYQQEPQHMAKQITKLCKWNRDMDRDKKRIANSKKAVHEWAQEYGLRWNEGQRFFELAENSRPVAAAHMQAAQDWVSQGGDRKLWRSLERRQDSDLDQLPFAWVTNAHGLGGRTFE